MKTEASPSRYPSPLRYPGGKGKVANFIKLLFLENDLVGAEYAEPYAGGAGVALSLLYEKYASRIHINDLDADVYAFWHAVLQDTEALCKRVVDTSVTMEEWHRQRAILASDEVDPLDLAFATFFLNRTNRSGIIGGGVIGGQEQDGSWKLDARYNKTGLVQRIKKVALFKSQITLTPFDAAYYIRRILPSIDTNALVYLDPPYFLKSQRLYRNAYDASAHAEIARLVSGIKQQWVVSYDAVDEITALYSAYEPLKYDLSYSAQKSYRGNELMFFKPGLKQPDVASPANIRAPIVEAARQGRSASPYPWPDQLSPKMS